MPRSTTYSPSDLLTAAGTLVAEGGPSKATVGAISEVSGAPVGSIYHRFPSREVLLAHLWLRTVEGFQRGFLKVLGDGPPHPAGLNAALYTPRWVRRNLTDARILLLHRRSDFLTPDAPSELRKRAEALAQQVADGIGSYAAAALGNSGKAEVRRATFAVIDIPYAAVRSYVVAARRPPAFVDELIADAYRGVMRIGAAPDGGV
ncbi:MAG TPA: TetR/AcrR family transcriptional regulator [Micromonosporaceae bacterium]